MLFATFDGQFRSFLEAEPTGDQRHIAEVTCREAATDLNVTVPPIRFFYDGHYSTLNGFCTADGIAINVCRSDGDVRRVVLHEMWHWRELNRPASQRRSEESEERWARIFELSWPSWRKVKEGKPPRQQCTQQSTV